MRYVAYALTFILSLLFLGLGYLYEGFLWPLALTGPLALMGTYDLFQQRHNLLRNYPLLAYFRWFFEAIRPEIRQYLLESETEATPFSREQRSLVYQRAKCVNDKDPFGTELDLYGEGYEWLIPSIAPKAKPETLFRVEVGGPQCERPYRASAFNISAMSFGSLSANAICALSKGAALGEFALDTGEGGISRYHREFGGDLIWEIGSGYFGCRHDDGTFDPELFSEQARDGQVKMIELKLSQGAKPGHGGVLPGCKVTPEIAETRKVRAWTDVISPPYHSAFSTPIEMLEFIARLRALSGGKPTGFKLCVGQGWEFMAICKAMLETEILPDFVTVDGAEGGTGAAPLELANHVGTPLREGLLFVHNALVGTGVRDRIRVAASGKVHSGFKMAANMALGADWCNAARPFMFALGCVQSKRCHTNHCPTGVTSQNPRRQRAIVVPEKAERVSNFHHQTVHALGEVIATLGLEHPGELRPHYLCRRISDSDIRTADQIYPFLQAGELVDGCSQPMYRKCWDMARPDSFQRSVG